MNLLFAQVDLPVLDKKLAAEQILAIPNRYSFWDNYRSTKMIPLMTKSGMEASNHVSGEFNWTPHTPTIISDWFDHVVFPWMGMRARTMALITQPQFPNTEHIDCEPNELDTQQHKFRIVLQGRTDTLYFITDKGRVPAPEIDSAFIMDGGWPHGMTNTTDEVKVTLAVGAPWTGNDHYDNIELLMNRNDYRMPDNLSAYWRNSSTKK